MGAQLSALDVVYEAAAAVLARNGIRFRAGQRGAVAWYGMAVCPLCGADGYRCGTSGRASRRSTSRG